MKPTINGFDHVALSVSDVAASCAFYEAVLGLETMQRPPFQFPGAWYSLGSGQGLHLIGKKDVQPDHSHHFAMRIDNLELWLSHLDKHQITYRGPHARPDGIQQIFFSDPDNNLIELDYGSTR
jgi:catechol 2,3-dioxygenase-like lactoylglutathione lyase family enzyme